MNDGPYKGTMVVKGFETKMLQVIAALRQRLDEMKQQLSAKDRELREKQQEQVQEPVN